MPIKRYDGSGQVSQTARRWNGSAWVKQLVKRWNGSAWVTVSATLHTWQKWDVETTTTVTQYTQSGGGGTYLDPISSISTWRLASGYSFDSNTGAFTVSGDVSAVANGGGYELSGGDLNAYTVTPDGGNPDQCFVLLSVYTATPSAWSYDHSKGTTRYADVTSYNPSAYPEKGIQDGYWYVKV